MLGYQLFHEPADLFEPVAWLDRLNPDLLTELGELSDALAPHAHAVDTPRIVPEWPLHLHRRNERREVQTACVHWASQGKPRHREDPLRLNDLKIELFFVTLNKREGGGSGEPEHDPGRHPTGRRYTQQAANGWRFLMFVRETREDAFVALGPVRYMSHTGERPMGITWKLDLPLPAALFETFAALLAA
jgi:hypothetical protein